MSVSTPKDQFTNNTNTKINGKRRTRAERGLPEDDAMQKLARLYLEAQRQLWPDLVRVHPYAKPTDHDINALVESFKTQFLARELNDDPDIATATSSSDFGVAYLRYSCDKSNPRSLDDQLRLQLELARDKNEFIPWRYVFADASVSGTHSDRTGYQLAKKAVESDPKVATLYIDELSRASRDMIESLNLGQIVQGLGKKILGASDRYDSRDSGAKLQLQVYGIINEQQVDQTRKRVRRGMRGAVERGTSTGKQAIGYKLQTLCDESGRPACGKDGAPLNVSVVDQDTRQHVELAFKLYGEDHWSGTRIAKHFNKLQINGKGSWNGSSIYQMLRRHQYIGIRVYNQTTSRKDPYTGKIRTIQNDRSEWLFNRNRDWQIIPWKLWKKVQRRLLEAQSASPSFGKKRGVNKRLFARTLFDGTLFCGCCGRELSLGRSAGRYKQAACPNGCESRHGCTFKGSKSIRIIDQALLSYLRDNLLNAEHIQTLVKRVNHYLAEEAKKPRTDTTGLEQTLTELTLKRDRLVEAIEDDSAGDVAVVVDRLKDIEAQMKGAKARLAEIMKANAVPPKPLKVEDVVQMLGIIDEILNQEPAAAAPVLREITGPITVNQKTVPGRKKPVWVATFGPNLVPLLSRTARENSYPDTSTWEFLSERRWIMASQTELALDAVPAYVQYAKEVIRLVNEEHMNSTEAARSLGIDPQTARQAYKFSKHGLKSDDVDPNHGKQETSFKRTQGAEVAHRRDELDQPFHVIAEAMGVTRETARKAYNLHHQQIAEKTGDTERLKDLGRNSRMSLTKRQRIREMLKAGHSVNEVVAEVGCSKTVVYREKRKL